MDESEVRRLETPEEREQIFGALRHLPVRVVESDDVPPGTMDIEVVITVSPGTSNRILDTIAVVKEHNADGETTHEDATRDS